jgi:hypothetical protein
MECQNYRKVTADFIQRLLVDRRLPSFQRRVASLQHYYCKGIAGQQNDSRIATNFALLGASFYEIARYLADVWPEWKSAARHFLTRDLIAIRDEMAGTVKEHQASEVFWSVLGMLIEHEAVSIDTENAEKGKPVIGKRHHKRPNRVIAGNTDLYCISTGLALAAVNKHLREQGKPDLKVTETTLLAQLRNDGRLLDEDGMPLDAASPSTRQLRIDGVRRRSFITSRSAIQEQDWNSKPGWSPHVWQAVGQ